MRACLRAGELALAIDARVGALVAEPSVELVLDATPSDEHTSSSSSDLEKRTVTTSDELPTTSEQSCGNDDDDDDETWSTLALERRTLPEHEHTLLQRFGCARGPDDGALARARCALVTLVYEASVRAASRDECDDAYRAALVDARAAVAELELEPSTHSSVAFAFVVDAALASVVEADERLLRLVLASRPVLSCTPPSAVGFALLLVLVLEHAASPLAPTLALAAAVASCYVSTDLRGEPRALEVLLALARFEATRGVLTSGALDGAARMADILVPLTDPHFVRAAAADDRLRAARVAFWSALRTSLSVPARSYSPLLAHSATTTNIATSTVTMLANVGALTEYYFAAPPALLLAAFFVCVGSVAADDVREHTLPRVVGESGAPSAAAVLERVRTLGGMRDLLEYASGARPPLGLACRVRRVVRVPRMTSAPDTPSTTTAVAPSTSLPDATTVASPSV